MARKTKGELISDLELKFTQGKPSDDFETEKDQIGLWLDIAANAILSDYIGKQLGKLKDIDPEYIRVSEMITPSSENITGVDASSQRYYVDISSLDILPIEGYSRDYGVVRLSDQYNKHLVNILPDESDYYSELWFSKADNTEGRYLWYRENGSIYIDGLNPAALEDVRVFYIPIIDSTALADTDTYPIGEKLLPLIIDIAYEVGLEQIHKGIMDTDNDGIQ